MSINQSQNKNILVGIIISSVLITLAIWLGSKWFYDDWFVDWQRYVAKTASLSATILMTWSIILAARLTVFEQLAGGLDKLYKTHKHIGMYSLELILLHPLFLSLRFIPNFTEVFLFFGLKDWSVQYYFGHNLGIFSLLLLIILIFLSINSKIPYQLWKKSHEFMGLVYLLLIGHIFLVDADISAYPVLQIWMYSWLVFGLLAYMYKRFLYLQFGPKYKYKIEKIEKIDDILEITFSPVNKPLLYKPAQIIYTQFKNQKISPDLHPFSIASCSNKEGGIKLGIKMLGDFTKSLNNLALGDQVTFFGPYGQFSNKLLNSTKDCVFIGGGVGITPFIGMWEYSLSKGVSPINSAKIHLLYAVNYKHEASFDNDIKQITKRFMSGKTLSSLGHSYHLHITSEKGYLNSDYIETTVGSLTDKYFFLCGPKPMTNTLIKQLKLKGVTNQQIIMEDFDLLAGNPSLYLKIWKKLKMLFRFKIM